jgi:hypothetical protein
MSLPDAVDALRGPVEDAVQERYGSGATVTGWVADAYATSHPLAAVTVTGAGAPVELVLKHVGSLLPGAEAAKPVHVRDPRRERTVYRELLPRVAIGTPACIATGDTWVLVERAPGVELYQVDDRAVWVGVAAWLRTAHDRLAPFVPEAEQVGGWGDVLLRHEGHHLLGWAARAAAALRGTAAGPWAAAVLERYGSVVDRLDALPRTILHGELYASNVVVAGAPPDLRVCAVDWEMAGIGPGLLDLVALVAGGWSPLDRAAIEAGYLVGGLPVDPADLDACRLQVAMTWLGWSRSWQPPPQHAHDWLADAMAASDRLSLTSRS